MSDLDWRENRKGAKRHDRADEVSRFWSKVEITDGCWLWKSASAKGYGAFTAWRNGKWCMVRPHIYAYELLVGPVPEGRELHHEVCHNKICCNPSHLLPLTKSEHSFKSDSLAGKRIAQTHCKRGHPFDAVNSYIRPNGTKFCRQCVIDNQRARYQAAPYAERTKKQRDYRHSRAAEQ